MASAFERRPIQLRSSRAIASNSVLLRLFLALFCASFNRRLSSSIFLISLVFMRAFSCLL